MIYGPINLSGATDADLYFNYWLLTEANYDFFTWGASVNGTNFYGWRTSGNSGGWRQKMFDLANVPGLGNISGRSQVWLAFIFDSDFSVNNKGVFVDGIRLYKYTPSGTTSCPGQYKAEYFSNRTLSGTPTFTRCEGWPISRNWGTGGPGNGVPNDNFSVRWTGTANMAAGTYTFLAAADDGIRVWFDNSLIIDQWRDQGPTAYRVNRTVGAGSHTIRVEYYEYGGGALAEFGWSPANVNGVPGILYGTQDGFHVWIVDMWSSNLSFETVMAGDVTSGQSTRVEYVDEMAGRSPYASRNPVLVFNADYFGEGHHGAEGFTMKNGVRIPNAGTGNGEEWRRSSLSVSQYKGLRIGRQTECSGPPDNACSTWTPTAWYYYNTVGGGPLFIDGGQRIGGSGSTLPCTNEFPPERQQNWYCTSSIRWTAAGVTNNGRYMIVVASNGTRTMDQAAAVLIAKGANLSGLAKAIKFDGGASTQVWYKPNGLIVPGGRRVTNAMMIFSSQ
jgi:hypothetical protein